ncbi:two-component sensor histidine kinase [Paracoccus sp. R12_1]|uniref:sensor histidine kinase n=1 Tax=unclassified Paracoccus (in: a-proteobacteria) TaxID=2688777 RepID=UPI001AD9A7E3|nr:MULTISPECIES: ATP-binding protein [unclassified Paracoccus (in: a-proteobacteria)]MBO9454143.1 two-component sensor histidine kinase [Paracoccus sp. R12_2]MBO9484928.1 two-component sensor histidine kinase [Paracoccus sp. R12_1]
MSRATQRNADAFLSGVPVPMLAVDGRARTIAANAAATSLFGPDLLDRPFVTVLRHPAVVEAVDWVLQPDRHPAPPPDPALPTPPEGVVSLRAQVIADGRDIAAEITVAPLPAALGRGATVAIIDQSVADEAEQMRRDFVANVSHELKTPLTAMIGFIETLRGPARGDPKARDRFLDIMEREANRMNRLVADLLSLSRVQAEERRRPSSEVDLPMMLRGVLATMAQAAEAAGVEVETDGLEGSRLLPGDPDQLVQVFQNLIENALKYGASGGHLGVRLRRIEYEPLMRGPALAVDISDRGEGIEERHLPRLTERFYRVDTHRSRAQGGTGLGLAIVKHIVNRHRGRLKIESRKAGGSRFTVILPEKLTRA